MPLQNPHKELQFVQYSHRAEVSNHHSCSTDAVLCSLYYTGSTKTAAVRAGTLTVCWPAFVTASRVCMSEDAARMGCSSRLCVSLGQSPGNN